MHAAASHGPLDPERPCRGRKVPGRPRFKLAIVLVVASFGQQQLEPHDRGCLISGL